MPFTKSLPRWEAAGSAPSLSKMTAGWGVSEKPPADWFNWHWNTTYLALQELQQNAVHKDGSTTFTGQIKSNLAAGTAPFSVVSSTLVTNLNADMLDGLHSATASTANTIAARSASGYITATRFVSDIAQGSAPLQVTSTSLVANLNADLLDGMHSSSAMAINTIVARDGNGDIAGRQLTSTIATGARPLNITSTTLVDNLNADLLDGYHASQTGTPTDSNTVAVRNASGNIHAVSLVSNVTTGTPPIYVSSTTLVTNLNADSVDGYHVNTTGTAANSIPYRDGNATISANRFYSMVATGTSPFVVTSSTLVANLNADLLDGYEATTTSAANTVVVQDATQAINIGASLTRRGSSAGGQVHQGMYSSADAAGLRWGVGMAAAETGTGNVGADYSIWAYDDTGAGLGQAMKITRAGLGVAFSGAVTAPRFISSQAQGTAPFQVTSSTLVTNLNADQLDGFHASTATAASTIVVRDANQDVFFRRATLTAATGTAPFSISSTTLVTNLNADLLDGLQGANYMQTGTVVADADMNAINTAGVYRMQAGLMSNLPGSGYYYGQTLVLHAPGTDTAAQLIFPYIKATGPMYRRGNPAEVGGAGTYSPWFKIWTEENMGADGGLDADKLDNYHADTANTASTVVVRDANRIINAFRLATRLGSTVGGQLHQAMYMNDADSGLRWGTGMYGAEAAGNVGADWALWCYDNTGATLEKAFSITRSNRAATFASSVSATRLNLAATAPIISLSETDQGTDEKNWAILADAKAIRFRALNDAQSAYTEPFVIQRGTGTAITGMSLSATNITLTTGSTTVQSAGDAILYLNNTTGAANAKVGYVSYYNGLLKFGTANDAGLGSNHLTISNTGVIAVSNSTVASNLNADMLDGLHADTSSLANSIAARDAGANILANVFRSTVATGTAPFIVASSTLVTNLNASYVSGFAASQTSSGGYIPVRDANKKIAEVAANRIVVREALLGTTNATVATHTAATSALYTVKVSVRTNATPSVGVSINVNYTGPGGTKSEVLASSQYLQTGDYYFPVALFNANAGSAINVVAAASQTNSAWVSAVITEEG